MIELISFGDRIVAVDIVGTFGATKAAELTQYPIENGTTRSDHKIRKQDTLEVTIQQTEHPIDDPLYAMATNTLRYETSNTSAKNTKLEIEKVRTRILNPLLLAGGAVRSGLSALAGAVLPPSINGLKTAALKKNSFDFTALQTSTPRDRGAELDALLTEILDSDETCTVTYRGVSHPSMSLVSITKTFERANLTSFQCSFQELVTATIERVALPNPEDLAHKAKKNLGKNSGGEKDVDSGKKPVSVLRAITR